MGERPIVVTGATGNVGREVVAALLRQGRAVRTATPEADVAARLFPEAAHAHFDFEAASTFEAALGDAGAVFLMRPPLVSDVRRVMGPAIDFLAERGTPVVFLSVMGAGGNPLLPHHRVERLLRRSGLPWTFLRPSFFMQNLSTTYRADIRDRGELFVPAGRGRTSFIDVRDIAEVAVRVLGRPEHAGRAYTLTGDEALSYFDVADILTRVLGRPVRYAAPSPAEFRRRLQAQGTPPDLARVLSRIYLVCRLGLAANVTPDTGRLLGRAPIRFEAFARDTAEAWQTGVSEYVST